MPLACQLPEYHYNGGADWVSVYIHSDLCNSCSTKRSFWRMTGAPRDVRCRVVYGCPVSNLFTPPYSCIILTLSSKDYPQLFNKSKTWKRAALRVAAYSASSMVSERIYQPGQSIDIDDYPLFACGMCWRIYGSGLYCTPCGGCQRFSEGKRLNLILAAHRIIVEGTG